ncbi:SDR family NAD(P)-dependent oxidoreductase [Sphingomicrobium sp. XHP0235]|uniref:SDR family NAD(P)-dependent oxidoreductase n=1 Tax=Sphingomicrobium aquimarinum TaxID=3133971 RepID=UPI0031FE9C81
MEKRALITGARHRLGEAMTRHLLDAGWTVHAHVRGADDEVASGAHKVVADLAEADCAERVFAQIDEPPTLLINNASLFEEDGLDAPDAALFDRQMAVNVRAPLLLTSAFAHAHAGSAVGPDRLIVNIGDSKLAAPHPDHLSYTLSKAALKSLTETSARALGPRRIRVNMIAPAMILPSPGMDAEKFAAMHDFNPLGRGVEIAHLLAALDHLVANDVVTGTCLWLDGGQRLMGLPRDVAYLEKDES